MKKNLYVTQPSLPELKRYNSYLKKIWKSKILTHNGPFVQKLEEDLKKKLKIKYLVSLSSGTSAIQASIRALSLEGEIITTPFTWIASIDAILWERCRPVFVDVDKSTFNIDVSQIEKKINKKTVAILAVHTFSNPCNVNVIDKIAKKHNLKIIYDAAHAMFVNINGKSLLEYGNISAVSFHATKIFNTVEGGACISNSKINFEKLKRIRFFGFNEKKKIKHLGINMKMTELHAAMGLANLNSIDNDLAKRKKIYYIYKKYLGNDKRLLFQNFNINSYNFSYMPVIIKNKRKMKNLILQFKKKNIFPRRYFYPSLNKVKFLQNRERYKNSEYLSERIICLPMYPQLKNSEIKKISSVLLKYV